MKTALTSITFISVVADRVYGHGYMKSPRSRNYKAYEDGVYWGGTEIDPNPESCPHCLNRAGPLARCGIVGNNDYAKPRNYNGGPLQWSTESVYTPGSIIDIDSVITAYHKGHIEVKACPLAHLEEIPSQQCFDSHPLEFISDELYGAPKDITYPGRAYLAPPEVTQTDTSGVAGMLYKFKFKLPSEVFGNVLLQWYYITANSCTAEGYNTYPFPAGWGTTADFCPHIPDDGVGTPEQFWNCGEVYIQDGSDLTPAPTSSTPSPNNTSEEPTISPVSGTCIDSTEAFKAEKPGDKGWVKMKTCDGWTKRKSTAWRCKYVVGVKENCPLTCTHCCLDIKGSFNLLGNNKSKSCVWAAKAPDIRCRKPPTRQLCAITCGECK